MRNLPEKGRSRHIENRRPQFYTSLHENCKTYIPRSESLFCVPIAHGVYVCDIDIIFNIYNIALARNLHRH